MVHPFSEKTDQDKKEENVEKEDGEMKKKIIISTYLVFYLIC